MRKDKLEQNISKCNRIDVGGTSLESAYIESRGDLDEQCGPFGMCIPVDEKEMRRTWELEDKHRRISVGNPGSSTWGPGDALIKE